MLLRESSDLCVEYSSISSTIRFIVIIQSGIDQFVCLLEWLIVFVKDQFFVVVDCHGWGSGEFGSWQLLPDWRALFLKKSSMSTGCLFAWDWVLKRRDFFTDHSTVSRGQGSAFKDCFSKHGFVKPSETCGSENISPAKAHFQTRHQAASPHPLTKTFSVDSVVLWSSHSNVPPLMQCLSD